MQRGNDIADKLMPQYCRWGFDREVIVLIAVV